MGMKEYLTLGVAFLLVASVFGTAIGIGVSVEDESLFEGSVTEENPIEIHDWYDLDDVRDDLDENYVLMNDLGEETDGYDELASEEAYGRDRFEQELGSVFGNDAGERFELAYTPIEDILRAEDTGEGFEEVEVEIIDSERGLIELKEETQGKLFVEYKTVEETGLGWVPIDGTYDDFTGTFDGNGHEIRNLYINRAKESFVGLFGNTEGAMITNVSLIDANVGGEDRVGGLVGGKWASTMENSFVTGEVTGGDSVGGLIGVSGVSGTVKTSYARADVSGIDGVGGLMGVAEFITVNQCYATGNVSGEEKVGGLVGSKYEGTIKNSYATVDVEGDLWVGGLMGRSTTTLKNTYATGSVSGEEDVGGLLGNHVGKIENSFWDIETTGQEESDGGTDLTTEEMTGIDAEGNMEGFASKTSGM